MNERVVFIPPRGEWHTASFCYLTTTGRRSGNPHEIEIWFGFRDGTVYFLSGGGNRSDWVRNLLVNPSVSVRVGSDTRPGIARIVTNPAEEQVARRLLAEKYQAWTEGAPMSRWAREALPVAVDLR